MAEFLVLNKGHDFDKLESWEVSMYFEKGGDKWMSKYNQRQQRGDVIEVQPDGYWTKDKGFNLASFVVVAVPGIKPADVRGYSHQLTDIDGNVIKRRAYSIDIGSLTFKGGIATVNNLDKVIRKAI